MVALELDAPSQLTLFDMPPDRTWRLPEARSDRDKRIAVLMRNILWQHEAGGCHASNEFFASNPTMGLKCDVATIRRGLAHLEECGILRRDFDAFGQRTIVPLVTVEDLLAAGWEALARAIVGMKQWAGEVRSQCRELLRSLGKWYAPQRSQAKNCAVSARTIARPFPYKERQAQKMTTVTGPKLAGVVVSPAEVPEPDSEAVTVAVEAGLDRSAARRAVGEKPLETVRSAVKAARAYAVSHEVRSLPALLFTAIRAGWLAPAPPSSHASDLGERPQRIIVAPAQMRTETAPRLLESDSTTMAWDALSEDQRADCLALALTDALETASEAEKALVRRRGVNSLPVLMRAKRLARERAEALGASDAR